MGSQPSIAAAIVIILTDLGHPGCHGNMEHKPRTSIRLGPNFSNHNVQSLMEGVILPLFRIVEYSSYAGTQSISYIGLQQIFKT